MPARISMLQPDSGRGVQEWRTEPRDGTEAAAVLCQQYVERGQMVTPEARSELLHGPPMHSTGLCVVPDGHQVGQTSAGEEPCGTWVCLPLAPTPGEFWKVGGAEQPPWKAKREGRVSCARTRMSTWSASTGTPGELS